MTFQKLASAIAKREGKKSQVHVGNIREVLKVIVTLNAEHLLETGGEQDGPLASLMLASDKLANKLLKKKK